MKSIFLFITGTLTGLWIAWPGIFFFNNWKCFRDIIYKSSKEEISLKAVLSISPNFILKGKNNKKSSKLRILGDACFR